MSKYPKVNTRIRTPSKRFATIESYDSDDRVHVKYYDDEGGEGCFPAKLIRDCDLVEKPTPDVYAERASNVRRRGELEPAPEYTHYRTRTPVRGGKW